MSSNRRLQILSGQLMPGRVSASIHPCSSENRPDLGPASGNMRSPVREDIIKWNGWGFKDAKFALNEDGAATFAGSQYPISGQVFPKLIEWFEKECDASIDAKTPSQPLPHPSTLPLPIINEFFLQDIKANNFQYSMDPHTRLFHAHGHTCHEIFQLRHGKFERIPDVVLWPRCHEEVEKIVKAAVKFDVCIIPFGGGTSVSNALECPKEEQRMIVSLDMKCMNRILWIDEVNLTAHIEGGIIGQDLERHVSRYNIH